MIKTLEIDTDLIIYNGLGDPNIDRAYWLKILELPD